MSWFRLSNRASESDARPPLHLAEDAISLVRHAPASLLVAYYVGALPFVFGLLYVWAEMAYSVTAFRQLPLLSLLLALLFGWLKTWQTVYAAGLHACLLGEAPGPVRIRRLLAIARQQVPMQALGLLLLPLSLLVVAPVGYVYAYLQTYTLLADGEAAAEPPGRRARQLCRLWPRQNHLLIWMLSPMLLIVVTIFFVSLVPIMMEAQQEVGSMLSMVYGTVLVLALLTCSPMSAVVALNLGLAFITVPQLAKLLLGIETVFTLSASGMLNSTFFAIVCAATYLCLDPVVKAAYVLRCFEGDSRRTGQDLRVSLRRAIAPLVLAVLVLPGALPEARAEVSPEELDSGIEEVIERREFAWRSPRDIDLLMSEGEVSWFGQVLLDVAEAIESAAKAVGNTIGKVMRWIEDQFTPKPPPVDTKGPSINWGFGSGMNLLRLLLFGLVAVLLAIICWLAWKLWSRRRRPPVDELELVAGALPEIDLEDEQTQASELPEDEWLALARDLRSQGDLRLAMRAMFLATLANLAEQELIRLERYKTNRDYLRELRRRAHAAPDLPPAFTAMVGIFERAWYGMHLPEPTTVDEYESTAERIRDHALT